MRRTFSFRAGVAPARLRPALWLLLVLLALPGPSMAAVHAAVVVDAATGAVIYERNATARTYPASLTKMMTLYLLFDALERGDADLDAAFAVSRHAAAQAPTKLGLRPGETIKVRDLISALVTKSANDAAVVVAEGLAGGEAAFARRMTAMARRLGMNRTHFANASGLPAAGQYTTARDMAILSLALLRDHPRRYRHFSTRAFAWHGQTHLNHNHLLRSFKGMDGIKTGFINASGFNLAASAVRGGRRYVAVVMGGDTARARDTRVAALLEKAFAGRLGPADGKVLMAMNGEARNEGAVDGGAGERLIAAAATFSPLSTAHAAEAKTATALDDDAPQARTTVRKNRKATAPSSDRRWSVQVGAFADRGAAVRAARKAAAKLPGTQRITVVRPRNGRWYRSRLVRFTRTEARAACARLHRGGMECVPVARR